MWAFADTPETASGIHDGIRVHNGSTVQKYPIALWCQAPDGKKHHAQRYFEPSGLTWIVGIMAVWNPSPTGMRVP
jgi:hypothetical protein